MARLLLKNIYFINDKITLQNCYDFKGKATKCSRVQCHVCYAKGTFYRYWLSNNKERDKYWYGNHPSMQSWRKEIFLCSETCYNLLILKHL